MKITVVGAGAVGATCADNIARKELADELILLDIKEGFAEGKAIDMMQTAALLNFDTRIKGVTNDYAATADSEVVVITSGLPRKPGRIRLRPLPLQRPISPAFLAPSSGRPPRNGGSDRHTPS